MIMSSRKCITYKLWKHQNRKCKNDRNNSSLVYTKRKISLSSSCDVISTNLFGSVFPELFGSLGHSFFTLFQVMTLESWSDGIARPIMEKFPYAWVFFVIFILIATFVVVNLFIAVIVDSFASLKDDPAQEPQTLQSDEIVVKRDEFLAFQKELSDLRELITQLKRPQT